MTSEQDPAAAVWSLPQPSARRSLMLCALGAIVGLAIAGLGLFTAKGTRTSVVPAENVAMVNQVPILMSDYIAQIRALYEVPLSKATPKQKKQVLEDMIREELYVQRGIELGMQTDTIEVRTALVGAVEAQAAADATMAQPEEAQLRAWYQAHPVTYSDEGVMALDEYVLPGRDMAAAKSAVAALRAGGGAAATATRVGLRRTDRMTDSDEFYFAADIHLGAPLFAVAKGLKQGDVSDPVAQSDGLHILVMKRNDPPTPIPYDVVRDRVLSGYIVAQAKLLTAGNERFLRKRADIAIQKGFE